jgi:hypothetical protein
MYRQTNSFLIRQFLSIDRGRDRMVVGFTNTYAIIPYLHCCCEFESCDRSAVFSTNKKDRHIDPSLLLFHDIAEILLENGVAKPHNPNTTV